MEMKLNSQRIKKLRLRQSWTQEKLAGESGLNPRTIQRVESDGTGSLQTRLQIALALSVDPTELDSPPEITEVNSEHSMSEHSPNHFTEFMNYLNKPALFHLPLLLLISAIYLAWTPNFFTLSKTSFGYLNFIQLFQVSTLWLTLIVSLWIVVAALWLTIIYKKRKHLFKVHMVYLSTPLIFGVIRIWQPDLIMHFLSYGLYFSGLGLMVSFYFPQIKSQKLNIAFNIFLISYIFMWCFHGPLFSFSFGATSYWQNGMDIPAPWISINSYLLRNLSNLSQMFPIILILLFSIGNKNNTSHDEILLSVTPERA